MRDITGRSLSIKSLNANPINEDNETHFRTSIEELSKLSYRPGNSSFINSDLLEKIKIYHEDYFLINTLQ